MIPGFRMPAQVPGDFTRRLQTMRPAMDSADPGMAVQPYADPGYAMPNVNQGNLNQMPGQEVGGYLPALADLFRAQPNTAQMLSAGNGMDMRGAWAQLGRLLLGRGQP